MARAIMLAVFVFGFVAVLIILLMAQTSADKEAIAAWAGQHQVHSVERTLFDLGPFWVRSKHHRIYRVVLQDGQVVYFRFPALGSLCGYDVEYK